LYEKAKSPFSLVLGSLDLGGANALSHPLWLRYWFSVFTDKNEIFGDPRIRAHSPPFTKLLSEPHILKPDIKNIPIIIFNTSALNIQAG